MIKRVILASNSPRRRELLGRIIDDIRIAESRDIDESYPPTLAAAEVAQYIAHKKAEGYRDLVVDDDTVLITADTVVVNNGKVMGKPADRQEAIDMLKSLSGHTHHVYTGYALTTKDGIESHTECTAVTFTELSDSDIAHYVDTYKPYDKAGAYGIQEWIGEVGVSGINGDFYNVMGLPVCALYRNLQRR